MKRGRPLVVVSHRTEPRATVVNTSVVSGNATIRGSRPGSRPRTTSTSAASHLPPPDHGHENGAREERSRGGRSPRSRASIDAPADEPRPPREENGAHRPPRPASAHVPHRSGEDERKAAARQGAGEEQPPLAQLAGFRGPRPGACSMSAPPRARGVSSPEGSPEDHRREDLLERQAPLTLQRLHRLRRGEAPAVQWIATWSAIPRSPGGRGCSRRRSCRDRRGRRPPPGRRRRGRRRRGRAWGRRGAAAPGSGRGEGEHDRALLALRQPTEGPVHGHLGRGAALGDRRGVHRAWSRVQKAESWEAVISGCIRLLGTDADPGHEAWCAAYPGVLPEEGVPDPPRAGAGRGAPAQEGGLAGPLRPRSA